MIRQKKHMHWVFPAVMLLYTLIFLGAAFYGLRALWGYLAAYERTRPQPVLDAYMEALTPEHICGSSAGLIDSIDHSIQTPEECRKVLMAALSEEFTCAKKADACTADRQVFVLRSGKTVIGSMEMVRRGEPDHGFIPWEVAGDKFDLSFLVSGTVRATVPEGSTVYVNGHPLDDSYRISEPMEFPQLAEFYGEYDLPHLVTYAAGPCLGDISISAEDQDGNELDLSAPPEEHLQNCTEAQLQALNAVTDGFIRRYVDFTSCTGNDSKGNYARLKPYMVPDGALAKRMYNALDGLYWVSDRHASVTDISVALFTSIGGGRYICDLTYTVSTTDLTGAVEAVSHLKLTLLETAEGLWVESMRTC